MKAFFEKIHLWKIRNILNEVTWLHGLLATWHEEAYFSVS